MALAFGSAVHKCIETMHLLNKWDDTFMQRLWADTWYECQSGIDWDSVKERKKNRDKKGLEILEAYRETNSKDEWLALESHFRFNPNSTPRELIPSQVNFIEPALPLLRGTLDKVMYLQGLVGDLEEYNGRLAIIDYKTSKNPPDKLLLRVDPQLTIYHAAARAMWNENVVVAIHHLPTNTLHPTERTDRDINAVLEMIRSGKDRVDQERFERNISYACKWCPYKEQCLGGLARGES